MQVNLPGASAVGSASSVGSGAKPTTIREAAQQLESIFVDQLMEAMRRTSPKGGALKAGGGEEMFRQMFDQEISQRISQRGGVGIGEMLYKQLAPENATLRKLEPSRQPERIHAPQAEVKSGEMLYKQYPADEGQQRSKLEPLSKEEKVHASR